MSAIASLELAYLHEIGRARDSVSAMLTALNREVGLEVLDASLVELVKVAEGLTWTRDPFDRLIAAHAILEGAQLISADKQIRNNLPLAAWD